MGQVRAPLPAFGTSCHFFPLAKANVLSSYDCVNISIASSATRREMTTLREHVTRPSVARSTEPRTRLDKQARGEAVRTFSRPPTAQLAPS